jgi:acid phosphatase (class A)
MPSKLMIGVVLAMGAAGVGINQYAHEGRTAESRPAAAAFEHPGYLSPKEISEAVASIPPPPAPGSKAMQADEQARQAALPLRGTPRYALAAVDAVRTHPNTVDAFMCAFGSDISPERTPTLYQLLARVRVDVRMASYPAKSQYRRPRPFVLHQTHSCYADDEAMVRDDGSYPSARGAVGWAYALVLAELEPQRADAILRRGREFGESRVVCDQEWQSDVDAGRTVAELTVSRMRAKSEFMADLAKSRHEVAAELAAGVKPAKACGTEQAALGDQASPSM